VTFTGPIVLQTATPAATPMATPGGTPVARPRGTLVMVREVALPDRQRQEVSGLGGDDHEAVATGEEIFVRGPLAERIAPGAPPDVWVAVDPATLPEDSELLRLLGGLPRIPPTPLASIPERLLAQPVRDLGAVEFDGRECEIYGAVDTVAATGMRVDYAIAIDANDLPCYIETSTGGTSQGRDEYTAIDEAITIEVPVAATPVSVPPALATPAARD
jgi:hypothetical protein